MAGGHSDTFHHIRDYPHFELPFGVKIELPEIAFLPSPNKLIQKISGELPAGESVMGLQLTKFMVLQLVAAVIVFLVYRGLASRVRSGSAASGRWWNFWETLAVYIRDDVVRPTIGTGHSGHSHDDHSHDGHDGHGHGVSGDGVRDDGHPADRFLPFIWSCFFYVLVCNLLGAIPWLGSATAEINVTGVLAAVTLGMVIVVGVKQSGPIGFWVSLAPSMEMSAGLKAILVPVIWVIELVGFVIKHAVLAIRLFANIMAGHTVVSVILGFIALNMHHSLFYVVMPASVLGQIGIGLLELFVSFLQAYVFAFLATLFISVSVNPH